MSKFTVVSAVLVASLFCGSVSASCYAPNQKLHFVREKDPVTQGDILGTTIVGFVGGGIILGLVGGVMATTSSGGTFRDGFVTGATIGGAVTAFNAWQAVHQDRKFQQRRLRDALFYYLSHPDFADEHTTDEEHSYVSDLVQSFKTGIQARLDEKHVPYSGAFLLDQITAAAQKLDREQTGCSFKRGSRRVHSIEKLQRLVVRELTRSPE